MRISILGVQIDAVNAADVRRRIEEFLNETGSHTIVTPNPEFLVAAQSNGAFKEQLNRADLAIPDGIGLLLAARILRQPLRSRVTGVETVDMIAEIAARDGKSMFLLGGGEGISKRAADTLKKKYSVLKIVGAESGGEIQIQNAKWRMQNGNLIGKIQLTEPDVLLVALGQVKQELWIRDHLHLFPSVKIVMGVGGTFDYLAGAVALPPQFIRSLGLEWLWRLITQPWRVGRIYTATIHFIHLVLKSRFT